MAGTPIRGGLVGASVDPDSMQRVQAALRRFSAQKNQPIAKTIKQSCRRLAVNFAFITFPMSFSDATENFSKGKVARDVSIVFMGPSEVASQIDALANRNHERSLAKYVYGLLKQGNYDDARSVFRRMGMANLANVRIGVVPEKSFLRAMRGGPYKHVSISKRGFPGMIVTDYKQIERLIMESQKRVGLSAQGWAECAKQLGGTRGIARWKAKSHGVGYKNGRVMALQSPEIGFTFENTTPWVDKITPASGINAALQHEERTLLDLLERDMAAEARKFNTAA